MLKPATHVRIAVGSIALCFAVSLTVFSLRPHQAVRRVLFFPSSSDGDLVGEPRFLPRRAEGAAQLRILAEEMILGPRGRSLQAALPRSSEVRSLMISGVTAYVDLTATDLMRAARRSADAGPDALQTLASTLLFNQRQLRRVHVFIDGQLPRFGAQHDLASSEGRGFSGTLSR